MSWWKFWETEEDEPSLTTTDLRRLAETILTEGGWRELVRKIAERMIKENPERFFDQLGKLMQKAAESWAEEVKERLQAEIEGWKNDPLIMRRMNALDLSVAEFQEQTSATLDELLRLVKSLMGPEEPRENKAIADILDQLDELRRRVSALEAARSPQARPR